MTKSAIALKTIPVSEEEEPPSSTITRRETKEEEPPVRALSPEKIGSFVTFQLQTGTIGSGISVTESLLSKNYHVSFLYRTKNNPNSNL